MANAFGGFHLSFEMTGLAPVLKRLGGFKDSIAKKILRTALTKGGRILVNAVKKRTPKRFGFARKSIIWKVKVFGKLRAVMLVGPDKKKVAWVIPNKAFRFLQGKVRGPLNLKNPRPEKIRPVKYFHLIEQGFTRADGKQFPAQAPLRKAWAEKAAEVEKRIIQEIEAGIAKL